MPSNCRVSYNRIIVCECLSELYILTEKKSVKLYDTLTPRNTKSEGLTSAYHPANQLNNSNCSRKNVIHTYINMYTQGNFVQIIQNQTPWFRKKIRIKNKTSQ